MKKRMSVIMVIVITLVIASASLAVASDGFGLRPLRPSEFRYYTLLPGETHDEAAERILAIEYEFKLNALRDMYGEVVEGIEITTHRFDTEEEAEAFKNDLISSDFFTCHADESTPIEYQDINELDSDVVALRVRCSSIFGHLWEQSSTTTQLHFCTLCFFPHARPLCYMSENYTDKCTRNSCDALQFSWAHLGYLQCVPICH